MFSIEWKFPDWLTFRSSKATRVSPSGQGHEASRSFLNLEASDATLVVAQMTWASSFIGILPLPICLLDKKGFVHHMNEEFLELIFIPVDEKRCPYVGRFFHGPLFRACLEEVSHSGTALSNTLEISWLREHLRNSNTNELYEWTLSGSKKSEAVVITGRKKVYDHRASIAPFMADRDQFADEKSNIEKYKAAISQRSVNSKRPEARDDISKAAVQKWDRFLDRCKNFEADISHDASDGPVSGDQMRGFVEVITVATITETNLRRHQGESPNNGEPTPCDDVTKKSVGDNDKISAKI